METIKRIMFNTVILLLVLAFTGVSSQAQDWKLIEFPSYDHLTDVEMISVDTGYVVTASGYCFKTTDRGKSWLKSEVIKNVRLESLYFTDGQTGWTCGHNGSIFKTTDGGKSWLDHSIGDENAIFFDIEMISANKGLTVGMRPSKNSRLSSLVLRTGDGGKSWEKIDKMGLACSEVRQSKSGKKLFVLAMGLLNISNDEGETWESVGTFDGSPARTFSMFGSIGIMAGTKGACAYTNDSGKTWYEKRQDENSFFFTSVLLDEKRGYIAGRYGTMLITADGGLSWKQEVVPLELSILDLSYIDGYLFAVGGDGLVMYKNIKADQSKK